MNGRASFVVTGWLNGRVISKSYKRLGNARRGVGDRKVFPHGTEELLIQQVEADGTITTVDDYGNPN